MTPKVTMVTKCEVEEGGSSMGYHSLFTREASSIIPEHCEIISRDTLHVVQMVCVCIHSHPRQ